MTFMLFQTGTADSLLWNAKEGIMINNVFEHKMKATPLYGQKQPNLNISQNKTLSIMNCV